MRSAPPTDHTATAHASPPAPPGKLTGAYVALAIAALAVALGVLIPAETLSDFLSESGPVERSTAWLYLLAVLCVLLCHGRGTSALDTASACVVLLAMTMREQDMHKSMFEISILKSRFYIDAPWWQIAAALAVLLPIVAAIAWLAKRYARRWLSPPSQWNAPMVTLATLVATMVFTKVIDRVPATLNDFGLLELVPQVLVMVLLSLEEVLEWALPLLAIIGTLQIRSLRRAA